MFRKLQSLRLDRAHSSQLRILTEMCVQIWPAFKLDQTAPAPLTIGFSFSSHRSGCNLFGFSRPQAACESRRGMSMETMLLT